MSVLKRIKRTYKFIPSIIISSFFTIFGFYSGIDNIQEFSKNVGDVEVYSRFDFSIIPLGILMLGFTIAGVYYIFHEKRFEDAFGSTLNYIMLGAFFLSIVLTLITPSIYQNRFESAGLQKCKGIPSSYMPFFGTKFAKDKSLCRVNKSDL